MLDGYDNFQAKIVYLVNFGKIKCVIEKSSEVSNCFKKEFGLVNV